MRSSLSCDACRRSKVKCAHSGSPPCQRCQKSAIAGCLLTRPKTSRGDGFIRSRRTLSRRPPQKSADGPRQPRDEAQQQPLAQESPLAFDKARVDAHLANLSSGVILKTLSVFINSFPELAILHLSTFLDDFRSAQSPETKALLGAILAVTKAQLTASWAHPLLPREHYACYAKDMLSAFILQPPKIQVVQTLLVITLHEWGSRDFHKAWIYCGIAIRIMQALHSLRVAPYRLDSTSDHRHDAVSLAIETRTYWACFIMDCMVNSGTYNPPMLPMSEMHKLKIARPLGVVDFAFGPDALPQTVGAGHCLAGQTSEALDFTQSFEILVGGFDIWTQVMTFIFNDGRRAPGMCAPHNCPWVPTSPWSLSISQLEAWRAGQHRKLHYPSSSVAIHMTLGYGETFVYLNLLYYASTLMLHREYFPFLPAPNSEPAGPTDRSRLEAPAPPGWWEESARQLFGAAKHIARILHEASECGVHLMTPYAGFCAFSAAYINLYVFRYPRMNFNRSPDAETYLTMCLDYLQEFRHVWRIADGWTKTIRQASLLYERATKDKARYRGRTRDDFDTLHRSLHEFRVVDRSDDHHRELDGVESAAVSCSQEGMGETTGSTSTQECLVDTNSLLSQLLAEVSSNLDEQGAWSQWWPPVEQIEPPATE
ncbi:fungal specific transcription factor [Hirsutella rhossiliensis]|uniref:Fungal specific transcription factor domain-containing protein n=1 Tax=Hirsutella rhossiliensis TaxID=111463 RepID=A0A9P8MMZ4_9HYPO|nr:fungal specific transcription factor domain-containing protein [Hirsutella rhossiliensis]KAH0959188.1 fungal specific transcription factor domain-containing protein [Hirsutella rhossiliensis]